MSARQMYKKGTRGVRRWRDTRFSRGDQAARVKRDGFFFHYPASGENVREEKVLTRNRNLKVPLAWIDVHIAHGPSAKVQAVGYDTAGRLQYLYHPKYREREEQEKFEHILALRQPSPADAPDY